MLLSNNPNLTSSDATRRREHQRDKEVLSNVLKLGVAAGVGLVGKKIYESSSSDAVNTIWQKVLDNATGADYERLTGKLPSDSLNPKKRRLDSKILNLALTSEEASPFQILRALQVSNMLQTLRAADASNGIQITGRDVLAQEDYYRALLEKQGERKLILQDLMNGFMIKDEQMFATDGFGNVRGDPILKYAKAVTLLSDSSNNLDESEYRPGLNKIFGKMRNIVGIKDDVTFHSAAFARNGIDDIANDGIKIGIIGARSKQEFGLNVTRAYARSSMEGGLKVIDNVAGFVEEWFDSTPLKDSPTWQTVKSKMQTNLGTAGDYSHGVRSSIKSIIKNSGKKFGIAAAGFYLLNNLSQMVATKGSAYDKGIIEGVSTNLVNAHIKFAEVVSDRFQKRKEDQEAVAPGSTSLFTLAGFPMAGYTLGGTLSFLQRQQKTVGTNLAGALDDATEVRKLGFGLDKFIKGEFSRSKRYGIAGAAVGFLAALPFLPGALIGKSSEELKAEYSGDKEEAVKAGRWWFSGSYEFEGTKTKYFAKSWYARMMSGAKDKTLYQDKDPDDLNPIFSPFDYLRDPYKFEKMHKEDMPYPVWAMDVNVGSFLAKGFEKTIGQVIKPDKINPELSKLLAEQTTANSEYSDSNPNPEYGGLPSKQADGDREREGLNNIAFQLTDNANLPVDVNQDEYNLIKQGLMLPQESPSYNPNREGLKAIYSSAMDFSGIKGWAFNLSQKSLGLNIGYQPPQLARSGEATSSGRQIEDMNLGGIFGFGEAQRRIINTSSDLMYDRVNPLKNNMPNWLPGNDSDYYVNLREGNPYDTVENGFYRLPGAGYNLLHPELKETDPNKYPEIYKYKILADTAIGSKEYYNYKNKIEARLQAGKASKFEEEMYSEIESQSADRSILKRFREYDDVDTTNATFLGKAESSYWNLISHNAENPLESLTFFRPGGKLVHARTAIEDYKRTQLLGNDIGMWTSPYSHFIKPTMNQLADVAIPGSWKPQEAQERQNVDEYFDKLEYLKWRKVYKESYASGDMQTAYAAKINYGKTVAGSIASGLDQKDEMMRAYNALNDREKPYFNSFIREQDPDKREQILAMSSGSMGNMYRQIWSNVDYRNNNPSDDPYQLLQMKDMVEQNNLMDSLGVHDEFVKEKELTGAANAKEIVMDSLAEQYIQGTTGAVARDFIGWNPNLDVKDVKLKTLMVGEADIHEYGFWENDEDRVNRIIALDRDSEVVGNLEKIKKGMRSYRDMESAFMRSMRSNGYSLERIRSNASQRNEVNVTVNKEPGVYR